ncbi:hypothetical protein Y032_0275g1062 [Ancylostoma ceylanicum]|nr:hypothetical protein Y032_0275g1062 [Ancylostoma ceylanicum]
MFQVLKCEMEPEINHNHELGNQSAVRILSCEGTDAITVSPSGMERQASLNYAHVPISTSVTFPQFNISLTVPLPQFHTPQELAFQDISFHPRLAVETTEGTSFRQRDTVVRSSPAACSQPLKNRFDKSEQSEMELDYEAEDSEVEASQAVGAKRYCKGAQENARLPKTNKCTAELKRRHTGDSVTPSASTASKEVKPERKNPPCAVCGDPSTGIHFGADSCAACSAFFRRTVAVNRDFECTGDNFNDCASVKGSSSCKKCRFERCLSAGMDVYSVQCNRDSIGHYSRRAKMKQCKNEMSDSYCILNDLIMNFNSLDYRRQLLYCTECPVEEIFGMKEPPIREMKSVSECLYQMTHLEPRLAADFVRSLKFLNDAELPVKEMISLYKNFEVTRQAVEEPFLTYKYGLLDRNCWMMLNRSYIDIANTQKYFEDGTMDGMMLNRRTAENLFVPSMQDAMACVSRRMRTHEITKTEMIALYGIALYDAGVNGLSNETREKMLAARGLITKSLLERYHRDEDPDVRLGTLYLDVYTYAKVHAITTAENMHLLNIFDIIASSKEFVVEKWTRTKTTTAGASTSNQKETS